MDTVDAIVIGAGVVGLAVTRAFAIRGYETLLLEANEQFGTETSSRNSEVIHAGIYYPPVSLKGRLCRVGREELYKFCSTRGIRHRRCGKIIVATSDSQLADLTNISSMAIANGVALAQLSRKEALALEPQLSCVAGLYSPSTGVIDSHEYMLALLAEVESLGGILICNSRVTKIKLESKGLQIGINGEAPLLRARTVVNSGGLHAADIASSVEGFPAQTIPTIRFAKGNYFGLRGLCLFRHLVYPIPARTGLGIHLTMDLSGRARFGPDVQWIDNLNYDVDPSKAAQFLTAIREYWPTLPEGALLPAYAGIRPRIGNAGQPFSDFRIDGPKTHGISGLVNLFGIDSPGLTASLAIADYVANLISI